MVTNYYHEIKHGWEKSTYPQALVHVSTAYCNAIGEVVEEKLYPPPMDLDKAYELAKDLDGQITMQSLGKYSNE